MNPSRPWTFCLRRFAATTYDGLLLFAVLFFFAIPVVMLFPVSYGEPGYFLFLAYCHVIAFVYFSWFWVRSGQTLGMKTWGLRLLSLTGRPLGWWMAARRFLSILAFWIPALLMTQLLAEDYGAMWALTPLAIDFGWGIGQRRCAVLHDRLAGSVLAMERETP